MASSLTRSFTSQTELEMESSNARHWSELDESVTSSEWSAETNYTYFAELKNNPEWGRFFHDLRGLKVGEKISGGAQADVYEASMSGGPRFDMVVKVMKGNNSLQALQAQWPIGMLSARFKYKRLFDVIMTTIVGGTLLQDERLKGRFAFVMYRRWGDLRLLIDRRMKVRRSSCGPFSIEQAFHLILTIASDMDILHTKYDIIHRDLKASNVLVWKENGEEMKFSDDETLYVVVADFECSRLIMGTGFWKAPEIFQQLKDGVRGSEVKFTTMSDVYSFGMTCYEILSGSTPFDPEFDYCTRDEVLSGRRPNLSSDIPLFLRSIIMSCWHVNPEERPSFHDILKSLKHYRQPVIDNKVRNDATIIKVFISFKKILYNVTWPHTARLGKILLMNVYRNVTQFPNVTVVPGILAIHEDADIYSYTFKTQVKILQYLKEENHKLSKSEGAPIQYLIVDFTPFTNIYTRLGIMVFEMLKKSLKRKNIQLAFANPRSNFVISKLDDYEFLSDFCSEWFFFTVSEAIQVCTMLLNQAAADRTV